MSRIGKQPIPIPEGVDIKIEPDRIIVKGPKGTLEVPYGGGISFQIDGGQLFVHRRSASKRQKSLHGLYRALAANAVTGVTKGFEIGIEVIGTGYKVEQRGNNIFFQVGYSHPVEMIIPDGIEVEFDKKNRNRFRIRGCDKYLVGQYAAAVRSIRPPMTYKAKGIKYMHEVWRLKPAKAAAR